MSLLASTRCPAEILWSLRAPRPGPLQGVAATVVVAAAGGLQAAEDGVVIAAVRLVDHLLAGAGVLGLVAAPDVVDATVDGTPAQWPEPQGEEVAVHLGLEHVIKDVEVPRDNHDVPRLCVVHDRLFGVACLHYLDRGPACMVPVDVHEEEQPTSRPLPEADPLQVPERPHIDHAICQWLEHGWVVGPAQLLGSSKRGEVVDGRPGQTLQCIPSAVALLDAEQRDALLAVMAQHLVHAHLLLVIAARGTPPPDVVRHHRPLRWRPARACGLARRHGRAHRSRHVEGSAWEWADVAVRPALVEASLEVLE
mmetsp:Transcript_37529/g.112063  ORF Transcript_37529/g.112063 Transcript_37529/m.112063 type:complete len:309 (+) Transcript_37529:192-1118(+)